jgi:ADP-L-glycero-D-manno-heptose 6-epimerase
MASVMRVFITGVEGFIGQNFISSLPDDWIVSSYDLIDNPDLRPKDLKIEGNDWVLHLGALSSTTEKDVHRVMDLNLAWSIELAEECEKYGVNLQWASSASVYGNKYRCAMHEKLEVKPLNLYAYSKYFFEEYMKSKNPSIVWQGFRYFNVYGPREDHKGSQASPYNQFARQARETGVIRVFEGSENYKRDFVHVDRVIEVHLKMLEKKESGIFNIGTSSPRSFLDVARDVALMYNARIETIPFPEHLIGCYQEYTYADMFKTLTALSGY